MCNEELTQEEIVERITKGARARLDLCAESMIELARKGLLEDLHDVIDLLGLASMLDIDHPLYFEF